MLILITGGVKNGKSGMGETICQKINTGKMLYIATMPVNENDSEVIEKIAKHRELRKNKGFETLEKYTDLHEASYEGYDTVLIECVTNLTANEIFMKSGHAGVILGIEKIYEDVPNVVAITNDVFTEACEYGHETRRYIGSLAEINLLLAKRADIVIEAVCGIPVILKGNELYEKNIK